jgi:hypothetical protein
VERLLHQVFDNEEMNSMGRRLIPMIMCLAVATVAVPARAQKPAASKTQAQGATAKTGQKQVSMAEIRKAFDAYAITQAQEQVKLTKDQLPKFMAQYKELNDSRRMATQEHNRLLVELRQHVADAKVSEVQLKDRLKALRDVEERSHADVRKAYDEIDKLLDVRQQVRFRVFEKDMDRRMAQVIARTRQSNAAAKAVK